MNNGKYVVPDERNGWHCKPGILLVYCTLFIIHFSSSKAQTPTRGQLAGIWIGLHTELDLDAFCPLPVYLQLNADSTYHLGMVDGTATKRTSTWAIQGDSVRLDTVQFAPKLVTIQNDLLRIGTNLPLVFRRFTDVALDSVKTVQQLTGRVWQSDSLLIYLFADGKVALENPVTKQRTAHFWRVTRFDHSLFLIIQGNQYNREGDYKSFWQITNVAPKQLQTTGWNGRTVVSESFRLIRNLTTADHCRPNTFQSCDNCFFLMGSPRTFIDQEDVPSIRQIFQSHYQASNRPGQSGLLRVKFAVNCQNERGLFDVAGFGEDYCPKRFDSQITNQFITICREHIPANLSKGHISDRPTVIQPQDSVISFTFRLKDGHLIDMLP
ncbi:hypothetical protein [Spirosoma sp.]|uniref:hypothetical protein n=1 Tax=Spirosoma sp. TaxID=1899569 RepID=UPI003B3A2DB7